MSTSRYRGLDLSGQWPFPASPRRSGPVHPRELRSRQDALARAPLFASLPKRHVRAIAKVTGVSEYAAGATLVKEGEPGSVFFVILEGWANVVRGTRSTARLGAGDFFGEISLLDGGPRTASVVSRARMFCLELAKRDFDPILEQEPRVAARICRELARRLRERERPLVW